MSASQPTHKLVRGTGPYGQRAIDSQLLPTIISDIQEVKCDDKGGFVSVLARSDVDPIFVERGHYQSGLVLSSSLDSENGKISRFAIITETNSRHKLYLARECIGADFEWKNVGDVTFTLSRASPRAQSEVYSSFAAAVAGPRRQEDIFATVAWPRSLEPNWGLAVESHVVQLIIPTNVKGGLMMCWKRKDPAVCVRRPQEDGSLMPDVYTLLHGKDPEPELKHDEESAVESPMTSADKVKMWFAGLPPRREK